MDTLRQTLERIQGLYRRMNPSQRWSTGLAVFAIAVALGLLVLWSGQRHMVPLLLGAPADVTSRVIQTLETRAIPYELHNNILSVPVDQKDRLEIDLVGEGIFPEGQDVFSWVYDPDITETKGKRELKYLRSLTRRLQVMIESQAAVKSARVEITPAPQSAFLVQPEASKAAVTLQLQPGQKLKKETALAIARTVAAADRSLAPEDVTIVDTEGNLYRIPGDRDLAAVTSDQLEVKRNWEDYYQKKALDLLQFLNKKIVTVDVTLNFETRHEKSRVLDSEKTVPIEERSRTRDTKGYPLGNVPGVESNLGLSALPLTTGNGEKAQPATDTQSETETKSEPSYTETESSRPAGDAKEIAFAVIVDKDEVTARQSEIAKIQELLAQLVPGHDVRKVGVTPVSFAPPPAIPDPTTAERFEDLRLRYGDQALLLGVIVLALIMVSSVLKRAMPRDLQAEFDRVRQEMQQEDKLAAGVEETGPQTVQRGEQIRTKLRQMVQDNPRAAAAMLRRWAQGGQE